MYKEKVCIRIWNGFFPESSSGNCFRLCVGTSSEKIADDVVYWKFS